MSPTPGLPPALQAAIDAGQAAERQGRRSDARAHYEDALRRLDRSTPPATASALVRWIGRTYMDDGDLDAALDCYRAALAIARAAHDHAATGHALNLTAIALWRRGRLDHAARLFARARSASRRARDTRLVAMIDQNLGVIANIRGELDTALRRYRASLRTYRRLDDRASLGPLLNNLGMLYTDLRRWDDAERAYTEARQIATTLGDQNAQIMIAVNQTELWIARGDLDAARQTCHHALRTARRAGNRRAIAEALKFAGIIHRESGKSHAAERALLRAARRAEALEDRLLAAETARELAELAWRERRHRQTLRYLNRSHRLFSELRARLELAAVGRRIEELEQLFVQIVRQWSASIESKDRYTAGHCDRVATYACAIARRAGFDEQTLFWFRLGALLHDVGKIVVPTEILNKPGPLTPEERATMMRHPDAGVELLAGLEFPWDICPMVRHHHEWWNGSGYPLGLAGEKIPLSARILCIADVYDALTSDRSYRARLTPEEALETMRREAGTLFDPRLFTIFLDIMRAEHQLAPTG